MVAKKKMKKLPARLKKTAKSGRPAKKTATKKMAKRKAVQKKVARKKSPARKVVVKAKARGKKKPGAKTAPAAGERALIGNQRPDAEVFVPKRLRGQSAGQSGDLQGLSNLEGSDSESVDELLEEGNSFEAGVVAGVENAGNADEQEVHTHEVLEDDVPGEYLDED